MNTFSLVERWEGSGFEFATGVQKEYCLEIFIESIGVIYQFPVWGVDSASMFIVIKDKSDILYWLKAGEQLEMKYYMTSMARPVKSMITEVRNVSKQVVGPFKGDYLAQLKAVREAKYHTPRALTIENKPNLKLAV